MTDAAETGTYPRTMIEAGQEEIRVRRVDPSDLPGFDDFFERCFAAEYRPLFDDETFAVIERFARGSARDAVLAFEVEDAVALAAFSDVGARGTIVYAERHGTVYVWGLYVDPDRLRRGIGSALMSHVAAAVGATGVIEVRVLERSGKAVDFYRSVGFERTDVVDEEVFPGIVLPVTLMRCDASTARARSTMSRR